MFLPLARSLPARIYEELQHKEVEDPQTWLYLSIAIFLVLLGGVFAGLTIALMGQDEVYLQVLAASGNESEQKNARKVLNLLKRGKHWVLVTLLLGNVITNETLPIMLDRSLGGGWQAVLGSTVLIVIFGEVVPQSICVRFGLPIGAVMSPLTVSLMWLLAPVAWPTAKLLDYLLGTDHGTTYKKAGLKQLVTLHRTLGTSPDDRLNKDEVTIISAVLDLKEKPVGSIMTPMEDVFTLAADTILDEEMMNTILSEGYSRIPIYAIDDPENFIGMLLVKMLITYDPEDCLRVDDFQLATLPETRPETSCLDIVNFFQEGKSHMVLVSQYPGDSHGALGVCTLEDVIEELIGEEIIDESDVFVDVHKAVRRITPVSYFRVPKNDSEHRSPLLAPEDRIRRLSDSAHANSRIKRTKLKKRKSSGGAEDISLQNDDAILREHLKHLGPSNLASQPKSTRIGTVKIKPGTKPPLVTLPLQRSLTDDAVLTSDRPRAESDSGFLRRNPSDFALSPQQRALEIQTEAIETTGLLSAGPTASDGTHAIKYGSIGSSDTPKSKVIEPLITINEQPPTNANKLNAPSSKNQGTSPSYFSNVPTSNYPLAVSPSQVLASISAPVSPASSSAPAIGMNPQASFSVPEKLVISPTQTHDEVDPDEGSSGDTQSSSQSGVRQPPIGRHVSRKSTTRSGSIYERDTDINGVRKVVLDVQSAAEDDETGHENGDAKKKRKRRKKRKHTSKSGSKSGENNGSGGSTITEGVPLE